MQPEARLLRNLVMSHEFLQNKAGPIGLAFLSLAMGLLLRSEVHVDDPIHMQRRLAESDRIGKRVIGC